MNYFLKTPNILSDMKINHAIISDLKLRDLNEEFWP